MHRILCLVLLLVSVSSYGQQEIKQTTALSDFRSLEKDWQEIGQYYAQKREWKTNPQYALASKYFDIYLRERPSPVANEALDYALTMWSNLERGSFEIEKALEQVPVEDPVWERVGRNVLDAFEKDQRIDDGIVLLESLLGRMQTKEAKASILSFLSIHWFKSGNDLRAREGFQQLSDWNLSYNIGIELVRQYIQEIDRYTIGTPAPDFTVTTLKNQKVSLSDQRGKVILLHFWSEDCAPCKPEYPHLRKIARDYSTDDLVMLGIATDHDSTIVRQAIEKHALVWDQVMEPASNSKIDGSILHTYDITSIPRSFIIDREGILRFRRLRGLELETALKSVVDKE